MKTWVRKSLKVGILSAGILLVGGAAAASAADSTDNFGVAGGNQVSADAWSALTGSDSFCPRRASTGEPCCGFTAPFDIHQSEFSKGK